MGRSKDLFYMRWGDFRSNLTDGFQDLLRDETMVDVTLAAEGKYFKAHRVVLSVCSPYLKNLLEVNPCNHPIVFMTDVKYIVLSNMLQFMYKGEVGIMEENIPPFLKLASKLEVKGLAGEPIEVIENLFINNRGIRLSRVRKKKPKAVRKLKNEKSKPLNHNMMMEKQIVDAEGKRRSSHDLESVKKMKTGESAGFNVMRGDEIIEHQQDDDNNKENDPFAGLLVDKRKNEGVEDINSIFGDLQCDIRYYLQNVTLDDLETDVQNDLLNDLLNDLQSVIESDMGCSIPNTVEEAQRDVQNSSHTDIQDGRLSHVEYVVQSDAQSNAQDVQSGVQSHSQIHAQDVESDAQNDSQIHLQGVEIDAQRHSQIHTQDAQSDVQNHLQIYAQDAQSNIQNDSQITQDVQSDVQNDSQIHAQDVHAHNELQRDIEDAMLSHVECVVQSDMQHDMYSDERNILQSDAQNNFNGSYMADFDNNDSIGDVIYGNDVRFDQGVEHIEIGESSESCQSDEDDISEEEVTRGIAPDFASFALACFCFACYTTSSSSGFGVSLLPFRHPHPHPPLRSERII